MQGSRSKACDFAPFDKFQMIPVHSSDIQVRSLMNCSMMIHTLKLLTLSLFLSVAPAVLPDDMSGSAYAQACLSNAQANAAVRSGAAKSLAQVKGRATRGGGKIVSAKLCRQGGGFVYVISVLKSNGQVSNVTVNAN